MTLTRSLSICLLTILAVVLAFLVNVLVPADWQVWNAFLRSPASTIEPSPRFTEEADRKIRERYRMIEAELLGRVGHPWAGEYRSTTRHIALAPKAGAAYTRAGCTLIDQNLGKVTERNGTLAVRWELPLDDDVRTDTEFLAVQCGERTYLVEPERILSFCRDFRRGKLASVRPPELFYYGTTTVNYYLRVGDEEKLDEGPIQVPEGFEKYVSMKSIQANLVAVGERSARPADYPANWTKVSFPVKLNVGNVEGVLPRMEFKVTKPAGSDVTIRITKVRQHESDGIASYALEPGRRETRPRVGWQAATPE